MIDSVISRAIKDLTNKTKPKKKSGGGGPKGYKGLMLSAEKIPGRGKNIKKYRQDLSTTAAQGSISAGFETFLNNHFYQGIRTKIYT